MVSSLIDLRGAIRDIFSKITGAEVPENYEIKSELYEQCGDLIIKAQKDLIDDGIQKLIGDEVSKKLRRRGDPNQMNMFGNKHSEFIIAADERGHSKRYITKRAKLSQLLKSLERDAERIRKYTKELRQLESRIHQAKEMIKVAGNDKITMEEYDSKNPPAT